MLLLSSKVFLQLFQTNNPMGLFLKYAFISSLHTLMKVVVKPGVLDQVNSSLKLSKDLSNYENLLPCELMKLPTATKFSLQYADLSNEKKPSRLKNAKRSKMPKVQECCLFENQIARCASSLSLCNMVSDKQKCVNYFYRLIDKLYNLNRIS